MRLLQPYLEDPLGRKYKIDRISTIVGMLVLDNGKKKFDGDCPLKLYVGDNPIGEYSAKQLVGKIEKFKKRLQEVQEWSKDVLSYAHALGSIIIFSGNTNKPLNPYVRKIEKIANETLA